MSCVTCTGKHPCHSDTLWLKKRARCRSLQRPSRRSLDRRAATHSCISCKSCCVFLGCRRCSFVHTPQLYTTGTKCSNTPRRVPTRQRVIHSIAYLAVTLPINRLWWLFLDIPESLSISLSRVLVHLGPGQVQKRRPRLSTESLGPRPFGRCKRWTSVCQSSSPMRRRPQSMP